MPKTSDKRKPTDAEFNILGVIWDRGSATVREVYEQLSQKQNIGYTTVLKLMQIMLVKGILKRDTRVRPQVFRPALPRQQTQKLLLRDLLDRAFSGSAGPLVLQALSMQKSSPEELQEIRDLLDKLEHNTTKHPQSR